jgi:hypothetical protein
MYFFGSASARMILVAKDKNGAHEKKKKIGGMARYHTKKGGLRFLRWNDQKESYG